MPMERKDVVEDTTATMLALTHHIQNRLLQCAGKGNMTKNVADEIKGMARQIATAADRLGETK